MIKTFRGLLQNNTQTKIRLGTNDGLTGYKIKKLQLISENPGSTPHNENVVKIFTTPHTVTNTIDFNDPTLLAAAFYTQDASRIYNPSTTVVFDDKTFNQDIYLTVLQVDETGLVNFYLELEQTKLDLNEATVATLKDMRGRE